MRPSTAWVGVALLLGGLALAGWHVERGLLDWQPSLAIAQPWRAFSAVAVHYSRTHLLANLGAAALVGALGWAARASWPDVWAWLAAWPLTQLGLALRPDLAHYGGLSGVLHAGVAVLAMHLLIAGTRAQRGIGALVMAGLCAKVLSESPWGPALRAAPAWGISVAPLAHASGLCAGVLCAAIAHGVAWRPATPPTPPNPLTVCDPPTMSDRKSHLDVLAISLIVLCCFLWGLNQVAAKAALPEVPPLWQAAARSVGGALLVWLWARFRGIPMFGRDATLPGGLLAGALFAAEFVCIFVGLQYTTASRMVVFIYISPFVVALGMPFIARSERLSRLQMIGLLIAFGGVAWAFAEGFSRPAAGPHQLLGDALGVLAGIVWGATTLAIRGTALTVATAEKTLLYQLGVSSVLLTAAAWLTGPPAPALATLSLLAWSSMLFQVLVVTFFSYLVWFWLIRSYPATRLASFTLLTPVFGLLLGALLLGEPITPRLVVALAAVAAGIVLVNRRS